MGGASVAGGVAAKRRDVHWKEQKAYLMEKPVSFLLLLMSFLGSWSATGKQLLSGGSGVASSLAESVSRDALLHFNSSDSLDGIGLWCRAGERGRVSIRKGLKLKTSGLDFL